MNVEHGFHIMEHLSLLKKEAAMPNPELPGGAQAVDRASALLIHVMEAPVAPTLSFLSNAHHLPKSTTSRLLGALERQGLLRRNRTGAYLPGNALTRFARGRNQELDLAERMRTVLEGLAKKTGETSNLAVAGNGEVELIDQVDGRYLLGATNWVGAKVPYHCSALGKVFLAYGTVKIPPGRLERRTKKSITSRAVLLEELEKIRRNGYAVIKDELEEGLIAIAAPIREIDGSVIAAISISGPSSRISDSEIKNFGALIISDIAISQQKAGAA